MPIIAADFSIRLSGGAANSVGNASLGGAKSSSVAPETLDNLFDAVSSGEASAGDVEYRCVYLHNANASSQMEPAKVFISADTPLSGTTIAIGVGTSAVNATEQTIADENTAPSGVSFSSPTTLGTALSLGNIPAGQHRALWIRWTVNAATGPSASDAGQLTYNADFTS